MVYVFMADGFEEVEAITPVDILRRAGVEVQLVGVTGDIVESTRNVRLVTDTIIDKVDLSNAEMIVLPGGMPGTEHLRNSPQVKKAVLDAVQDHKFVCAICAAPTILAGFGVLDGKNATCYPDMEDMMMSAHIVDATVVQDGKFITSRGAGTSMEFAFALCKALKGQDIVDKIKDEIVYGK